MLVTFNHRKYSRVHLYIKCTSTLIMLVKHMGVSVAQTHDCAITSVKLNPFLTSKQINQTIWEWNHIYLFSIERKQPMCNFLFILLHMKNLIFEFRFHIHYFDLLLNYWCKGIFFLYTNKDVSPTGQIRQDSYVVVVVCCNNTKSITHLSSVKTCA